MSAQIKHRLPEPTAATPISDCGDLPVLATDNPGVWTDAEATELLHPDNARRVRLRRSSFRRRVWLLSLVRADLRLHQYASA